MDRNREQWSLYIDIEGFSKRLDPGIDGQQDQNNNSQHVQNLFKKSMLMAALEGFIKLIFKSIEFAEIHRQTNEGERIFAYQYGDGFLLATCYVTNGHAYKPDILLSIAIVVMQYMLIDYNTVCRASLSFGDLADWNLNIEDVEPNDNGAYWIGDSVIYTLNVIGTAIIRAVNLDKTSPKGPLLLIDKDAFDELPDNILPYTRKEGSCGIIDWINAEYDLVIKMAKHINSTNNQPTKDNLRDQLEKYINRNETLNDKWKTNARIMTQGYSEDSVRNTTAQE